MPLAAPDYFAGANDPKQGAQVLFQRAGWIRRRCNEIAAEAELDVMKVYDLAGNCALFRTEADKWRTGADFTAVLKQLIDLTRQAGTGNAVKTDAEINADYKALYTAAGSFVTFATNNLPAQGQPVPNVTLTVNRTFPSPDFTARVAKTAGVTNQINALRAVFV